MQADLFGTIDLYDIGGIILSLFAIRAIGHVWYSPYLFGKVWLEVSMREVREESSRAEVLLYGLLINLLTVVGLWMMVNVAGPGIVTGLFVGVLAWAAFALPTSLQTVVFEERPLNLILINTGMHALSYVVAGLIIGWTAGQAG